MASISLDPIAIPSSNVNGFGILDTLIVKNFYPITSNVSYISENYSIPAIIILTPLVDELAAFNEIFYTRRAAILLNIEGVSEIIPRDLLILESNYKKLTNYKYWSD